jgi:hypothetical protein
MTQETLSWFAGVDWGSERHHACLLDAQGHIVGEREFPHSGAGLAELGDWLLSMAGEAGTVAVAIEVPHGPVVDTLVDRGFVVHAINPKQLDRLRDRFSVAGAKHAPGLNRGTIAAMLMSWRTVSAPIGVCFAACMLPIRGSSNCAPGPAWPRN